MQNNLAQSISWAKKAGALSVTIHSNALGEGGAVVNYYSHSSDTVKLCSMYDTLLACAGRKINLNLKALKITTDHVGNFLKNAQIVVEICRLIGSPRLNIV